MKVILLAPTPPPAGGIAGWTVRMQTAELKNGWQVEVVDEKAIGSRQVFGAAGKRNLLDEARRCLNIWRDLRKALRDPEARVVHSCIPSVTFAMMREYVCARITRRRGRKFIIHFRCTVPNTTQGRLGWFMLKLLCKQSDLIFSLNVKSTECLKKFTATPIREIPNFIEKTELVETHEIREHIRTALYVGGIVRDKGVYDCLEIAKKMPEITFRLVGKGDPEAEETARAMGLNNVVFTGPKDREGVREELRNADVFLFMTYFRGEGFSNALCEAMAAGLPCVATDWAANADMVGTDGGAVVPVKDVQAAVSAIRAMDSAAVRTRQSAANINKVRTYYVDRVVQDKYVDAYEELLG